MNEKTKKLIIVLSIVIFILAVDLITKGLLDGKEIGVIKGVVSFVSEHNYGAAWSFLSGKVILLIIVSVLFLALFITFDIVEKQTHPLYTISFAMIIGGTLGNMIDRIFLGYVRDFICLDFINFPIFNIADCCLVLGVILYCVYYVFMWDKNKKESVKSE